MKPMQQLKKQFGSCGQRNQEAIYCMASPSNIYVSSYKKIVIYLSSRLHSLTRVIGKSSPSAISLVAPNLFFYGIGNLDWHLF